MKSLVATALSLAFATPLAAQAPEERDWSETLRTDAQALHDDIAANHPGPVNVEDPDFAKRNEEQLALALERAETADSYSDYFFGLRQYVSSFDDGHMSFGARGDTPNDFRWPGFATRYDANGAITVTTDLPGQPVPKGARLLGCDGMSADEYAQATLGRMWGRWWLGSQQQRFGALLFLDEGSRYIPQAESCSFDVDGSAMEVALEWRALSFEQMGELLQAAAPQTPYEFSASTLEDGTYWLSMPSFSADPHSTAAARLPDMIANLALHRDQLLDAPAVVLDLRGNGGGSSDWSWQLARVLWGEAALEAMPEERVEVDWRASPANLAEIAGAYAERRGTEGFSDEADLWFRSVIAGLEGAIARGDTLWRHVSLEEGAGEQEEADDTPAEPLRPLPTPVFVLTDSTCGSACLDAVDLWTALGGIHVGRTTSADTLYMEMRRFTLPSGLTSGGMPMKVFRGRPRGSNEPAVPRFAFDGDISDTAALAEWIAALP